MPTPFYRKVENFKEKISQCSNRDSIRQIVKELDLELRVTYISSGFFSLEESFKTGNFSGSLSLHLKTELLDSDHLITNAQVAPIWFCNNQTLSKEEMEKRYVSAIINTLKHLD